MRSLIVAALACGVLAAEAATTHLFTNTAGGSVDNTANWEAGLAPGTDPAAGSIVVITNMTYWDSAGTEATFMLDGNKVYNWPNLYFGGVTWGKYATNVWRLVGGTVRVSGNMDIRGPGVLKLSSGFNRTGGVVAQGNTIQVLGPRTEPIDLVAENGDIVLGSTEAADSSSGDILAPGSTLAAVNNGTIRVRQSAEAMSLSGGNVQATVELPAGTSLTLSGDTNNAPVSTSFSGGFSGSGTLVKRGARYSFEMDGIDATNRAFSGTLDVREGFMTIRAASAMTMPEGLVYYNTFDDYVDPTRNLVPATAARLPRMTLATIQNKAVADLAPCTRQDGIGPGVRGHAARFTSGKCLYYSWQSIFATQDNPFSVVLWVKSSASSGDNIRLFRWGGLANNNRHHACLRNNGVGFAINTGNATDYTFFENVSLHDGEWHMIACMYDGTLGHVSIDGSACESKNIGGNATSNNGSTFFIGGDSQNTGIFATENVSIDEFAVYNRVLSSDEISACYAAKRGAILTPAPPAPPPAPVAYWRFDDPSDLGKDEGPHNFHLVAGANKNGNKRAMIVQGSPFGGYCLCTSSSIMSSEVGYVLAESDTLPAGIPSGDATVTVTLWCNFGKSAWFTNTTVFHPFTWGIDNPLRLRPTGARTSLQAPDYDGVRTTYYGDEQLAVGTPNREWYSPVRRLVRENTSTGWHHVAIAYDKDTKLLAFYMDGVLVGSDTSSALDLAGGVYFCIGAQRTRHDSTWNSQAALIDEMKIYDVALTAEQVKEDRLSALRRSASAIPSSASLAVAEGSSVSVCGVRQEFSSVSNAGTIAVGDGGALVFDGGVHALGGTIAAGGQYSEAGTIEARNGATVNLAAACDDPTNVTVIVSNAVLAVSGTANVSVSIQDSGRFSGDAAMGGDLSVEAGGILASTSTVAVAGTATLAPGFKIDAGGVESGWRTIVSAGTLALDGVDLQSFQFENLPNRASGFLEVVGGTALRAKVGKSGVSIFIR